MDEKETCIEIVSCARCGGMGTIEIMTKKYHGNCPEDFEYIHNYDCSNEV